MWTSPSWSQWTPDSSMLKVVGASWVQTKIISSILAGLVALGVLVFIFGEYERAEEDGTYSATAYWSEDLGFRISFWGQGNNLQEVPSGIARAYYRPMLEDNGWATLEIESQPDSPDWRQAYAAGFLEGSLTWQVIYWQWLNVVQDSCEGRDDYCDQVRAFLDENWSWARETARELQGTDPFWHQVFLFYMQLEGLENGWRVGVERSLQELDIPSVDFLWLNVMSDLADLEQKFESPPHLFGLSSTRGFSSILVKLLPESRQLFVAHNTGGLYQSMLRMRKRYELHYHTTSAPNAPVVPGTSISFTSYPGALHSQDDLYHLAGSKHELVVVGSGINNHNEALWQRVEPSRQVLVGPRVMAANRLATCGHSWSQWVTHNASGTGCRQWAVADYGRLTAQPPLLRKRKWRHHHEVRGLLWVVEQLPGLMHAADQTHVLEKQGYWASSGGDPYFKEIIEASQETQGEPSDVMQILSRDQSQATDLESILELMRSNSYLDDPPQAVASRGDLSPQNPRPAGTIDTKVVVGSPKQRPTTTVVSGPAPVYLRGDGDYDDDDDVAEVTPQPFRWSSSPFQQLSHVGHPDVWHFPAVTCEWQWAKESAQLP